MTSCLWAMHINGGCRAIKAVDSVHDLMILVYGIYLNSILVISLTLNHRSQY